MAKTFTLVFSAEEAGAEDPVPGADDPAEEDSPPWDEQPASISSAINSAATEEIAFFILIGSFSGGAVRRPILYPIGFQPLHIHDDQPLPFPADDFPGQKGIQTPIKAGPSHMKHLRQLLHAGRAAPLPPGDSRAPPDTGAACRPTDHPLGQRFCG